MRAEFPAYTAALALWCAMAMAQPNPQQQPPNSTSIPGAQSQATSPPNGANGNTVQATGCLSGASGNYVLTTSAGRRYRLLGKDTDLQRYVGQTIAVRAASAMSQSGPASGARGGNAVGQPPSDASAPMEVDVIEAQVISPKCATSQGSGAAGARGAKAGPTTPSAEGEASSAAAATGSGGVSGQASTLEHPNPEVVPPKGPQVGISSQGQLPNRPPASVITREQLPHAAEGDQQLQREISDALQREPTLKDSAIVVGVANGQISLDGTVASDKDKNTATRIAQSFASGRPVQDKLVLVNSQNSLGKPSPARAPRPASPVK